MLSRYVMKNLWLLFSALLLWSPHLHAQSSGKVAYAPYPNDTYWHVPDERFQQWHLENRWTNGVRTGIDTNAREAWATTRGAGVVIAMVDDGVDLQHPDLLGQDVPELHYNFEFNTVDGNHPIDWFAHGTSVAGLALAKAYNNLGVAGLAPEARLASWVIYRTNGTFISSNAFAQMFQTHLDRVAVQNHSWFKPGSRLTSMSEAENLAIEKAVTQGRSGKGVIMVRAGGNGRLDGRDANADAYANDPRAITVAALEPSGRFATYSNPGACILVSAPGGKSFDGLFTTDRRGTLGWNQVNFSNDLADYVFFSQGFWGTSASAPLVSAAAALILSVNPDLHYRDVQQILIHSANPSDPGDPDARANGAGYVVSHHTGFGNIDAGRAVEHAKNWLSRPAKTVVRRAVTESKPFVDAGLYLTVSGPSVPANLTRIAAAPSLSVHPETSTPVMPLVDVGQATTPLTIDLTGKAALIQRGGAPFTNKIQHAVAAGAHLVIVYNNQPGDLLVMGSTETVPVPAIFVAQEDGDALAQYLAANPGASIQLNHERINYSIDLPDSLVCEHVGLRVRTTHTLRADVRITLVSPSGTTSVLQAINKDSQPGPTNWVYYSTHHFYEPSKGQWQVYLSDQWTANSGTAEEVELIVHGVPILDADADALDDNWEQQFFGGLTRGPREDPDQDGVQNAREQVLGTPPNQNTINFVLSVAAWRKGYIWLSWPSRAQAPYNLTARLSITTPGTPFALIPGGHQRTSVVLPSDEADAVFFRVTGP